MYYKNTHYDYLTELPNRRYLSEYYEENKNKKIALAFLDMDNLKLINDAYGHTIGDEVLRYISKKLINSLDDTSMVFRFGGDEFILIFVNKTKEEIQTCIENIISEVNKVFMINNKEIYTTVSAGIYIPSKEESLEEIIRKADIAMYHSKQKGKNRYTFFNEDMDYAIKKKADLIIKLKKAVEEDKEFYVVYQPIYNVESRKIEAVEALARWNSNKYSEIPPSEFIPLLEETGLIEKFGLNIQTVDIHIMSAVLFYFKKDFLNLCRINIVESFGGTTMLRIDDDKQQKLEIVMIENLVPQDHLLRIIDKNIDFSFIRDLTKDKYCENNGRPALDPVKFFKILFIGYLFGIRSERQLVKEIEVNVAYRWFLGMSLTDKVIDHSTLSKTRQRKYKNVNIFEEIFNHIVRIAIDKNLVKGNTLYIDSTHLKANANNKKHIKVEVEKSIKSYVDELEKAVNEEREKHGKKPLKKKEVKPEMKETKQSTTDPESGYMYRDNKPEGFFYLEHRIVDSKANIILDVHVTPGNVNDADFLIPRVDTIIEKFKLTPKYVGADAGYFVNHVCKELFDRTLKGVIAYRRSPHQKGKFPKTKFIYDIEKDVYMCPAEKELTYKTTSREGYSDYVCNKEICSACHLKDKCLPSKSEFKTVRRHVWEKYKELVKEFLKTEKGKGLYKRRKETVERSFADSKNLHGLRYCRMRGKVRVQEQSFLTAACQNMKKIARVLSHKGLSALFKENFTMIILNVFFKQAIA